MAQQLSLLELLERPTLDALVKPDQLFESEDREFVVRQSENTRYDGKVPKDRPKVPRHLPVGVREWPSSCRVA